MAYMFCKHIITFVHVCMYMYNVSISVLVLCTQTACQGKAPVQCQFVQDTFLIPIIASLKHIMSSSPVLQHPHTVLTQYELLQLASVHTYKLLNLPWFGHHHCWLTICSLHCVFLRLFPGEICASKW